MWPSVKNMKTKVKPKVALINPDSRRSLCGLRSWNENGLILNDKTKH